MAFNFFLILFSGRAQTPACTWKSEVTLQRMVLSLHPVSPVDKTQDLGYQFQLSSLTASPFTPESLPAPMLVFVCLSDLKWFLEMKLNPHAYKASTLLMELSIQPDALIMLPKRQPTYTLENTLRVSTSEP